MAESQQVTFIWHPGPDERIAPGAFDRMKGTPTRYRLPSGDAWPATVVDVEVIEDGRGARFTVDVQVPAGAAAAPTDSRSLSIARPEILGPAWAELWDRLGLDEDEDGAR